MTADQEPILLRGGCHCGQVRFSVRMRAPLTAHACNCSICEKVGFLHLITPAAEFALDTGADALVSYRFNTRVAEHLFCGACGVKSFYRPRSNPDGWSVNARCLDGFSALDLTIEPFNGREWEAHAGALAHLSQAAQA